MDINKMTERTQQAFIGGQELANERGNPELTELHLLKALMEQDESLLIRILSESGKSVNLFDIELNKELDRLPEVSRGCFSGLHVILPTANSDGCRKGNAEVGG